VLLNTIDLWDADHLGLADKAFGNNPERADRMKFVTTPIDVGKSLYQRLFATESK